MLIDEVHMDLNVFYALMLNRIVQNMNHTLVFTPKNYGPILGVAKLLQQLLKPKSLLNPTNSYFILYLNR